MEVSDATFSIFHFCGTLVFSIVFYIVSRAIAQMIDRGKTCGNEHGYAQHIRLYYSAPARYELKKLKG